MMAASNKASLENALVLGSFGMLGSEFAKRISGYAWGRSHMDAVNFQDLRKGITALRPQPSVIINCIAYNNVDAAEKDSAAAFLLNAELPKQLAQIAKELGITLVHYSSDYVFDGEKGNYAELDIPNPLSVYGASKLAGEKNVFESNALAYVIRTARLFGVKGRSPGSKRSFVELMLSLAQTESRVEAVADEIGNFTYVPDLVIATLALLNEKSAPGIYHLTNQDAASWFDAAKEIFKIRNLNIATVPVSADKFQRLARRPKRTALINTKSRPLRVWQDALKDFLG